VVDKLNYAVLHARGDAQEVERREMLDIFAQAHATRVRTDRNAELRSHQHDREVFVPSSHAARIELQNVDCLSLQKLLEDDPVLDVLARSYSRRGCLLPDAGVAQ